MYTDLKELNFILKKVLYPACALYTLLSAFVLVFGQTITDKAALTMSSVILLFLMSVLIALSTNIFRVRSIGLFFRAAIHMVLCILSVIFSMMIMNFFGAAYDLAAGKLILAVAFAIVYIAVMTPALLIYTHIKTKKEADKEYSSMFKKRS